MNALTVRDVMRPGRAQVATDAPVETIVEVLTERAVNAVPVVDSCGRVVGVVSATDLLPRIEFADGDDPSRWLPWQRQRAARANGVVAEDLMTAPATSVLAQTSVVTAARLMDSTNVRQLAVVNDLGRLVGTVTRHDLLRALLTKDHDSVIG